MRFKKYISCLLIVAVIFSSVALPSYASETGTPAIINAAEEFTGIIINYLAKLISQQYQRHR